jgi:hypothetical protein
MQPAIASGLYFFRHEKIALADSSCNPDPDHGCGIIIIPAAYPESSSKP